jgi:major membrane immunogen (membrane-anchored lipoprotein)
MKKTFLVSTLALGFLVACVTNRTALTASHSDRMFISGVKIGQAIDEVRAMMHKGPESQSVTALPDGTVETTWNYLTDYESDTNTTITFRNGKVTAINQTRWLGNGDFSVQQPPH